MSKRSASETTQPSAKRARTKSTALKRQASWKKQTSSNNWNVATIYSYPLPSKMKTRLKVIQSFGLKDNTTSGNATVFRPTSYFDVDPTIGGASFAGYTFYSGMYSRYRVTSFSYKASFVNLENSAVIVSVQAIPSDATPGSGAGTDWTEPAIENDWGQYAVAPPFGSTAEKVLKGYVDCEKLWGTPEVKTDSGWAATIGTNPVGNSWIRVAAKKADGTQLGLGTQCILEIQSYGYWDMKNTDVTN